MKHRKLRIAWSVAWGVAAVLLCVLWVRSYAWMEVAVRISDTHIWQLCAYTGKLFIAWSDDSEIASWSASRRGEGWYFYRRNVESWKHTSPPPILSRSTHERAIPIWALAILSLSLIVVPWLPKRFSLRTLLIATTLVAVALGIIVWMNRAG